MKAARLHEYHQALKLDSVGEPKATGPFDVVVKIGAAGLCRSGVTNVEVGDTVIVHPFISCGLCTP